VEKGWRWEGIEYLGCELIRDRSAKTAKIVQKVSAERVLKTFGMWDCKPCATPLDANSRLSKTDCPQVVDPALPRRYRSITGCLSYLVNMTRPDFAFSYFQFRKFVQYLWYIFRLLSECNNTCVVLMIKELLIVTLELKSRTN
jgi:hypothetical protein